MQQEEVEQMAKKFYYEEIAPRMPGEPTPTNERAMIRNLEVLIRCVDLSARHWGNCPAQHGGECVCT